jgi:hypothetical protein
MIVNVIEAPKDLKYDYGDDYELDDWCLKELEELELDEIWYWYKASSYEGNGQLLMRRGVEYDLEDMGHCSCNGPTELATFKGNSFEELEASITEGYMKEVAVLFDAARGSNKPAWEL